MENSLGRMSGVKAAAPLTAPHAAALALSEESEAAGQHARSGDPGRTWEKRWLESLLRVFKANATCESDKQGLVPPILVRARKPSKCQARMHIRFSLSLPIEHRAHLRLAEHGA